MGGVSYTADTIGNTVFLADGRIGARPRAGTSHNGRSTSQKWKSSGFSMAEEMWYARPRDVAQRSLPQLQQLPLCYESLMLIGTCLGDQEPEVGEIMLKSTNDGGAGYFVSWSNEW